MIKSIKNFSWVVLFIVPAWAIAQNNFNYKKIENMKDTIGQVYFIDKFFIPKGSIKEFTERMNYNRRFIKNLPGFITDEAYEQKDGDGNLTVITVAAWRNQQSINNAKNAVQAEYKRIGFNPVEFYQRLNIKMERGAYSALED